MKFEAYRKDRGEQGYGDLSNVKTGESIEKFLERFLKFEIGYGGKITVVGDNYIETTTHIMGKVDTTRFTAESNEEKIILFSLAKIVLEEMSKEDSQNEVIEKIHTVLNEKKNEESYAISPMIFQMAMFMIGGSKMIEIILRRFEKEVNGKKD